MTETPLPLTARLAHNPRMSERTSYRVAVQVQSRYLPEQSEPDAQRYAFAYTVRLHNAGAVAARLLTRHWLITDAEGRTEEVRGDGVVGVQPLLQPGERYEYTSGAVLKTSLGTMQGSYLMQAIDGTRFAAKIPAFVLSVPRVLH